jgi:hypothetical protein
VKIVFDLATGRGRGHSGKRRSASAGLRREYPARRPHAIGRASRVRGALGFRVLTRLAGYSAVVSRHLHASRGPLSLLAGTRAQTLSALGYAASEVSPTARAPSLASAGAEPEAPVLSSRDVDERVD